jgi:hypothetical protein
VFTPRPLTLVKAEPLAAGSPAPTPVDFAEEYNAARSLANDIKQLWRDEQLPRAKREAMARDYGDLAVDLLRQAVTKGLRDARLLRDDPVLAPLRDRADFFQLLREVEGGAPPEADAGGWQPASWTARAG